MDSNNINKMGGLCYFAIFRIRWTMRLHLMYTVKNLTAKNLTAVHCIFVFRKLKRFFCVNKPISTLTPLYLRLHYSYRITKEWYVQLLVGFIVWYSDECKLFEQRCRCRYSFHWLHIRRRIKSINIPKQKIMKEICGHYL